MNTPVIVLAVVLTCIVWAIKDLIFLNLKKKKVKKKEEVSEANSLWNEIIDLAEIDAGHYTLEDERARCFKIGIKYFKEQGEYHLIISDKIIDFIAKHNLQRELGEIVGRLLTDQDCDLDPGKTTMILAAISQQSGNSERFWNGCRETNYPLYEWFHENAEIFKLARSHDKK